MFYQLKHITKNVYSADEKLFHISIHGARDGCTGLNKSCLAHPQMTNRQGVTLPISAMLQNVLSGTVVGNVLGVCYACYALKTYIYWFYNKSSLSSRLKPFCSSLSNSQYFGSQYVLIRCPHIPPRFCIIFSICWTCSRREYAWNILSWMLST
jgi:hypothetical protein